MRIVGEIRYPPVGMRGPTRDEIEASVENSKLMPCVIPTGVYRYRSHAEANADMDRWIAQGMAARARELAEHQAMTIARPRSGPLGWLFRILER